MTRLFVAIWPPADVVSTLAALPRPDVSGVRWSAPDQWMVKVRPLGQVADRLVEPLVTALADALDGAPAIECAVGPATRRLGGQWLGAPVNGLDDLAAAVFEATAEIVPVTHPQPFQTDIVLARGRVPSDLAGASVGAAWTADAVFLVADRSSPHDIRFDDLAEFRLGG
jgi:2'-5' RNA ligase